VIGLPPSAAAVKETVNELSPDVIELIVGAVGALAVKPEVMTRLPVPLRAMATNFCCPVGPPQATENHQLSAAEVCVVQVMPSGLVMTRLPVPVLATATNFCCPVGPPQTTENQLLSAAEVCVVQVMPSGLVMTRLPVPLFATATNFCCPVGPPQAIERQSLSAGEVCVVQVMPSARTVIAEKVDTAAISAKNKTKTKRRIRVTSILRSKIHISYD